MPKPTIKPFVPTGSYADRGKAIEAAKKMPFPCEVVRNLIGTYSILRKS